MINFNNIRKIDSSQEAGFEEFVCQIARKEKNYNAKFHRLGNPDGGLECYWQFDDGSVIGWQAKFFTNTFSTSQWTQIRNSVKSALNNFKLRKIIIAVPYDLTLIGTKKLDKEINKWKNLSEAEGKHFEVEFWGKSELISIISKQNFEGFRKFWFDELELSDEWFETNANKTINNLGNITKFEVPINKDLKLINPIYRNKTFKSYFFNELHTIINSCKAEIDKLHLKIYKFKSFEIINSVCELNQFLMSIICTIKKDFSNLDFDKMECLDLDRYNDAIYMTMNILNRYIDIFKNSDTEILKNIANQLNQIKIEIEELMVTV